MTSPLPHPASTAGSTSAARVWKDEQTGRQVRQLTNLPQGAMVSYFRCPRHIPGGWVLAYGQHEKGSLLAIHPQSGEVKLLELPAGLSPLRLRESDGRLFCVDAQRRLWGVDLPAGQPQMLGQWPAEIPADVCDVCCDGRTVVFTSYHQDLKQYPIPTTMDVASVWHYFNRPRHGSLWTCDLVSGKFSMIYEVFGVIPLHVDASPADPGLIRFCHDMYDAYGQRVWAIRTDGSELRKIRPQEYGELVTHEFWWADANYIGLTYQDRRGDATMESLPWAEYSPRPTQLGLADLSGREVYLSDPLNSYHTHLFMSPDGRYVCGEGTEGHSFAYAAAFDRNKTHIDMVPLATIHTPYVPFRGQNVETGFSHDSRWLLFNDKIDGKHQVCAAKVDF